MGLESIDTVATDTKQEVYNEKDTVCIAKGYYHTIVERTYIDNFKILYLRTEYVMILDYDFTPELTCLDVEAECFNACVRDKKLCLYLFKTPRGIHVMIVDRVFDMYSNNLDILNMATCFPNCDLLNWKASIDRLTWGARLTHKPGETSPVAEFLRSIGSGDMCKEARIVIDEYERLLKDLN